MDDATVREADSVGDGADSSTPPPDAAHRARAGWRQWLTPVVVLVVAFFLVRSIYRQWGAVTQFQWSLRWDLLLLSAILVWLDFVILILLWRLILVQVGNRRLRFWRAYRVWFLSNFGKYVPGKVWALMGMVYLLKDEGYAAAPVLVSAVLNQALSIVSGSILAVIVLGVGAFGGLPPWFLVAIVAIAALALYPPFLQRLINLGLRWVRRDPVEIPLSFGTIAILFICYLGTWIIYGGAFWLLLVSIGVPAAGSIMKIVAIFTASYLVGFLALFVPGGLGVREGALALLADPILPTGLAAPVAVLSRIWLTVTELIGAIPLLWIKGPADTT
jgi:glycosyltransferase 2 family protein